MNRTYVQDMVNPSQLVVPQLRARLISAFSRDLSGNLASDSGGIGQIQREFVDIAIPQLEPITTGTIPRGQLIHLASYATLSLSTSVALDICASAQNQACRLTKQPCWCAWLDPGKSLHGAAVCAHGIALQRFVVVYPPVKALGRIAVKVVQSHVFDVVVIDLHGVPGASVWPPMAFWQNSVRQLALAARQTNCCVLLLSAQYGFGYMALPTAMRIEMQQPAPGVLRARVAKDRYGRLTEYVQWKYNKGK